MTVKLKTLDVIAETIKNDFSEENYTFKQFAEIVVSNLTNAGICLLAVTDEDTRREVEQRVTEMRDMAKLIRDDPDGIATEDDAEAWERDADLLARAYLREDEANV